MSKGGGVYIYLRQKKCPPLEYGNQTTLSCFFSLFLFFFFVETATARTLQRCPGTHTNTLPTLYSTLRVSYVG